MFVRKYSNAVHRNGAIAQASNLLRREASATTVENMVQIKPPTKPINPTNAAAIHDPIFRYCPITVSTQGKHTGKKTCPCRNPYSGASFSGAPAEAKTSRPSATL